ncbi:MAG TPA: crosslink repair DNA glycosylase YcaQ family protein [Dehalococcoidia bacterium]|nr:crosslink repair DNA glycosylase YcaQ family protein [Dehalococcoidia bacterium]
MTARRRVSAARAKRIALAAQGFADPRPSGSVTGAHLNRLMRRVGLLQLDSVNVLVRAHYMPAFSRLGPYSRDLLDDYAYKKRRLFEYWAHEASLIPIEHFPLFRHRMQSGRRWRIEEWADGRRDYVDEVLRQIRERGPLKVSGLDQPGERAGSWWGWGDGKIALEYLFNRGLIFTRARPAFTRVYDLTERVIPKRTHEAPAPPAHDAHRQLLLMAAQSLGIGAAGDIADYYRLPLTESRKLLHELVAAGELEEVEVPGWRANAYLYTKARIPRRINARALLSPFDSLIWATAPSGGARPRDRTERLFGFRYVLEIYTPPPKRVYGYYVLPFLLGEDLVARVDLKSDRAAGKLLVRAAYAEDGVNRVAVARELSEELASMAAWLGLVDVVVEPKGDLALALRSAFG